jgi:hypothetical protein
MRGGLRAAPIGYLATTLQSSGYVSTPSQERLTALTEV